MSSDIITCLQLDKVLPSRIIVVKEINGCDSSFINSCMLSHCIKHKTCVFFITIHNSINHYQNVGLKMNYNLQRHIDSGLIEFYNLGEELVNNVINKNDNILQDISLKIKEKVSEKQKQYESVNIVIDGVSHLFDMQFTLREVTIFCKEMFNLLRNTNSFLMYVCNEVGDDDVTYVMSNILIHKAHTVLEVKSLQSGWSTDVSGHLTVRYPGLKFDKEHIFKLDIKPTAYLFKLFDRGVKLLAPGTV